MPVSMKYLGWRRPLTGGSWQRVDGAEATTRTEAYNLLMMRSELVGGTTGEWEYQILPEGETPKRDTPPQTYRHRMLRPGGMG